MQNLCNIALTCISILKVKGNSNVSPAIRISLIQSDEWWVKRARPQVSTLGPALVLPQSMLQAYWTVKYVKYAWLFQSNFSLCHACKKVFSWVFFSGLRCTGHTGWLPDHWLLSLSLSLSPLNCIIFRRLSPGLGLARQ